MVPFIKAAADIAAQEEQTLQNIYKHLPVLVAANDDKYHARYFREEEAAAANV